MSAEFHCCHGTPESGHRPNCPYDKAFWGPDGVQIAKMGFGVGINFHELGSVQHGPGSAYAKSIAERGAAGISSAPVAQPAALQPQAKAKKKDVPQTESLFS